ncbi:MAG: Ketol-acid reductoisomerase [Syntrophus sp. SKADARSKE-3]|nr:Ketol-acid reductoisomerase (NAD(+)) [Syntrophus sp. SKADARSKE-3]MDQ5987696.1 Ketol-acid reductoisomerase [Syntrophus sp. SKADARSKE-3]
MAQLNIGGVMEEVITAEEFTLDMAREALKNEVVAVVGYGVQGRGQALNMKDNGIHVIVGEGDYNWNKAIEEGFVPGETLFPPLEAAKRGTIIQYLMNDATQKIMWPDLKPYLTAGKALYFSHGFSIVYKEQTGIIPPADIDVILVAPKGAGRTVRDNFLAGSGINSSFAIFQDATGRARERTLATGVAIGSGYLFPTTFEQEVYSDLTGERGVLMGCLAGVLEAQYNELRKRGHSPSEAFNETVEELTQSLMPLVAQNGMDWMYANCSTTAQRGALDWKGRFRDAVAPVFTALYDSVASGKETEIVLKAGSAPNYRDQLQKELDEIKNSEMWLAGTALRALRPERRKK